MLGWWRNLAGWQMEFGMQDSYKGQLPPSRMGRPLRNMSPDVPRCMVVEAGQGQIG